MTDAASGTSITITVGARLRVVLRSTYWEFGAPPAGGVLVLAAEPTTSVDSSCIPGGGCGVVSEVFTGVRPGQVHIVASRTTCGEAFACTGSQGRFDLTVAVSA